MVDVPPDVVKFHDAFVAFVGNQPPRKHRISISLRKLSKFPPSQLGELCTDVYDELGRRRQFVAGASPHLPYRQDIHQKRNNARYQLGDLSAERFGDMCRDMVAELERRYPGFHGSETIPEETSSVSSLNRADTEASAKSTPSHGGIDLTGYSPGNSSGTQDAVSPVSQHGDTSGRRSTSFDAGRPRSPGYGQNMAKIFEIPAPDSPGLKRENVPPRIDTSAASATLERDQSIIAKSSGSGHHLVPSTVTPTKSRMVIDGEASDLSEDDVEYEDYDPRTTRSESFKSAAPEATRSFRLPDDDDDGLYDDEAAKGRVLSADTSGTDANFAEPSALNKEQAFARSESTEVPPNTESSTPKAGELEPSTARSEPETRNLEFGASNSLPTSNDWELNPFTAKNKDLELSAPGSEPKTGDWEPSALSSSLKTSDLERSASGSILEARDREAGASKSVPKAGGLESRASTSKPRGLEPDSSGPREVAYHKPGRSEHEIANPEELLRVKDEQISELYTECTRLDENVNDLERKLINLTASHSQATDKAAQLQALLDKNVPVTGMDHAGQLDLEKEKSLALQDIIERQESQIAELTKQKSSFGVDGADHDLREKYDNLFKEHVALKSQGRKDQTKSRSADQQDTEFDDLTRAHIALKSELERQQLVTDQVKKEASMFLEEMRSLTQRETSNTDVIANLQNQVQALRLEVQEWKSEFFRVKDENRALQANKRASMLDPPELLSSSGFYKIDGLIEAHLVRSFNNSLDQLLVNARSPDSNLLNYLHKVIVSTRAIVDSIDQTGGKFVNTTGLISRTANQLIAVVRNYLASQGLIPLSLLDAACSDLAFSVVELLKSAGIQSPRRIHQDRDSVARNSTVVPATATDRDGPELNRKGVAFIDGATQRPMLVDTDSMAHSHISTQTQSFASAYDSFGAESPEKSLNRQSVNLEGGEWRQGREILSFSGPPHGHYPEESTQPVSGRDLKPDVTTGQSSQGPSRDFAHDDSVADQTLGLGDVSVGQTPQMPTRQFARAHYMENSDPNMTPKVTSGSFSRPVSTDYTNDSFSRGDRPGDVLSPQKLLNRHSVDRYQAEDSVPSEVRARDRSPEKSPARMPVRPPQLRSGASEEHTGAEAIRVSPEPPLHREAMARRSRNARAPLLDITLDRNMVALQSYLEEQTSETVGLVTDLLSGVRDNVVLAELLPLVGSVTKSVDALVENTGNLMHRTNNQFLQDKGSFILQSLGDSAQRLTDVSDDLERLQPSAHAPSQVRKRLAGHSYDIAKFTKELVKTVEEVSLRGELSQIDSALDAR